MTTSFIQGETLFKRFLNKYRTTGFTHLVKQLVEANAIDCIHDITVGYPAGLIRNENDLIEGKMPKEGTDLAVFFS